MPAIPTIAEAVAAFKQYVETLRQRPDVLVMDGSYVGPPADADLLRRLRETPDYRGNAGRMPADLLDLYELMNGAYVHWQYRQQPDNPNEEWNFGHERGAIEIPPLDEDSWFQTDDTNERTFMGPDAISLLFDEPQMEYGIWLVAYAPGGPDQTPPDEYEPWSMSEEQEEFILANADVANAQLMYAYENDNRPLRMTIAEYLLQATAHDLRHYWQIGEDEADEENPEEADDESDD